MIIQYPLRQFPLLNLDWQLLRLVSAVMSRSTSFCIGLVFGYFANPWAWTYFVFVVSLLMRRQRVDEANCVEKYCADKWGSTRHG